MHKFDYVYSPKDKDDFITINVNLSVTNSEQYELFLETESSIDSQDVSCILNDMQDGVLKRMKIIINNDWQVLIKINKKTYKVSLGDNLAASLMEV